MEDLAYIVQYPIVIEIFHDDPWLIHINYTFQLSGRAYGVWNVSPAIGTNKRQHILNAAFLLYILYPGCGRWTSSEMGDHDLFFQGDAGHKPH